MKIIAPDFYKDFRCLAGACPDSCCRQGWQIAVDEEHLALYEKMQGEVGEKVRNALTTTDGDTVWAMDEHGVCPLLEEDGLCLLAKTHGEESLCHLCHTHPRFIEGYGGTKEIHLSLQCPEAARLTLDRTDPLQYEETFAEEEIIPCDIDPDEYLALLEMRKFCLWLLRQRRWHINDRLTLLLQFARFAQNILDEKKYELCKPLCHKFRNPVFVRRQIAAAGRLRLSGTSFFPEIGLYRSLEHLTEDFPALLHTAVFTAKESRNFDETRAVQTELLATSYLAHYIPKAVSDGRVDTKIRLAVLFCLTIRRFCICTGKETTHDVSHFAGLLAKEIEHSEENMASVYAALEHPGWHRQLLAQIDLQKE